MDTVLVGDSSSSTLLSAYPQIAQQFPNNLACIFIRNTSATDSEDKLPFDTSAFKNLPNSSYFFYRTAEGTSTPSLHLYARVRSRTFVDLMGLNITNGQCRNDSVPQNITFGEQGGIVGNNSGAVALGATQYATVVFAAVVALALSSF